MNGPVSVAVLDELAGCERRIRAVQARQVDLQVSATHCPSDQLRYREEVLRPDSPSG
jgi:hypothetical protein